MKIQLLILLSRRTIGKLPLKKVKVQLTIFYGNGEQVIPLHGIGREESGDEYLKLVKCGGGGEIVMGVLGKVYLLFAKICVE